MPERGLRRVSWVEVALLGAAFFGVAGFWILGAAVSHAVDGNAASFDNRVLLALRQPGNLALPVGPGWLQTVARDLTALGGATVLSLLTVGVSVYLLLESRRALAVLVFASVTSGGAVSIVLKEIWNRPRPTVVPHLTSISNASFPSGHSMLSSVTYFTLAALVTWATPRWRTKAFLLAAAGLLVGLIGCSRVYLGVHYPTDVLAGWCVGSAWAIGCSFAAHAIEQKQPLALPEPG